MTIIEAVGHNCSVRDLGLQDCLGGPVGSKTGGSCTRGGSLFDPLNPTGHYVLNLADEFDRIARPPPAPAPRTPLRTPLRPPPHPHPTHAPSARVSRCSSG